MPEQIAKKKRVRKTSNAMLTIRIERTVPAVDQNALNEWKKALDIVEPLRYEQPSPFPRYVVLEQSLPEAKFDLAKVIKAINGL